MRNDEMLLVFMFVALVTVAASVICGVIGMNVGSRKECGAGCGALLGFLLGILGLVIVLVMADKERDERGDYECPRCFGVVRPDARACRHCGVRFNRNHVLEVVE